MHFLFVTIKLLLLLLFSEEEEEEEEEEDEMRYLELIFSTFQKEIHHHHYLAVVSARASMFLGRLARQPLRAFFKLRRPNVVRLEKDAISNRNDAEVVEGPDSHLCLIAAKYTSCLLQMGRYLGQS